MKSTSVDVPPITAEVEGKFGRVSLVLSKLQVPNIPERPLTMLLSHRFSLQLLKLQSAQDIECHHCSFFRIFTIFVVNYISSVFPKLNTQPCTPFIPMFLPYTTSASPKLFHFQPIQAKAHSPCVSYFILLAGLMHSHFSAFQALLQFWLFPDLLSSVPPQNTSNPFSLTALGGSYFSQFPGPSVVL